MLSQIERDGRGQMPKRSSCGVVQSIFKVRWASIDKSSAREWPFCDSADLVMDGVAADPLLLCSLKRRFLG